MSMILMAGVACVVLCAMGTAARASNLKVPILSHWMVRAVTGVSGVLLMLAPQVVGPTSDTDEARRADVRDELRAAEERVRELERLQQTHREELATLEAMTAERQRDLDSGPSAPEERERMAEQVEQGKRVIAEGRTKAEQLAKLLEAARARRQELGARLGAKSQ